MSITKPSFLSASTKERLEPTGDFGLDITIKQTVDVTLDDIRPFENNPRGVVKNPAYDEIKSSISARGLDTPLKLTKRNRDDAYYILSDGGATRYMALVELWNETNDPKYFNHKFPFEPYTTELDLLIRHASENGNRGVMSWIENALQAQRIKDTYEDETGQKNISLRVLAEKITALGLSTNHGRLSEYKYTVDTLWPVIPNALKGGMGRPKVRNIKEIAESYSKWCMGNNALSDRDFELALRQALILSDPADSSEAFDIDNFKQLLHSEVANKSGIETSDVLKKEPENLAATSNGDGPKSVANSPIKPNSDSTSSPTDNKDNNVPDSSNAASDIPTPTQRTPNDLSPENLSARLIDRSNQALKIANDLFTKQCASLKDTFTSVGDENTAVALGFAVAAIDDDIQSIDIDSLEVLVYCKLHQLFVLSIEAQVEAGLLDDYELKDEILESCKTEVYASVFWSQALLLSTTAYYDALKIKSKLRAPVELMTEDEFYVVNSLSQLEELLASLYLDLCTL